MIKLSTLLEEIEQEKVIADKVKQLEADLEAQFPQIQDLHLFIKSNGSLYIQSIRIKPEERRKGIGSQIIDKIKKFADGHNLTISLAPEPEPRYKEKLHKFYKRHGFIFNKGRHKDWQLSEPFSSTMYRRPQKEAMDTSTVISSPMIQQSFDRSFLNYMKNVENGILKGYDRSKNLWFPHESYEGGLPTIGYGHKIKTKNELNRMNRGVTDSEINRMLTQDLETAKKSVEDYIEKRYKVKLMLEKNQQEMLVDFAFHLGSLDKFPEFTEAVLKKDWNTVKKEYKRHARGKELTGRNDSFYQRYLKNL